MLLFYLEYLGKVSCEMTLDLRKVSADFCGYLGQEEMAARKNMVETRASLTLERQLAFDPL